MHSIISLSTFFNLSFAFINFVAFVFIYFASFADLLCALRFLHFAEQEKTDKSDKPEPFQATKLPPFQFCMAGLHSSPNGG
jgi:hypothetical protein